MTDEEEGVRRSLTLAADVPPPPDLPQRVLANPRIRRRATLTESPARRWTVIAVAAAAVAGVAIGVTMIGAAARPDQAPVSAQIVTSTPPAPTSTAPSVTPAVVPPLLARGRYQPWSDQTVPCDGAAAVPSAAQQLLNPRATVVGAVVCDTGTRYIPGDGIWTVAGARTLTAAQVTHSRGAECEERADRSGGDVYRERRADPRLHPHSRRRQPGPARSAR